MNGLRRLGTGAMALTLIACGADDGSSADQTGDQPEVIGKGTGKEDAWDYRNDPARLAQFANKNLEYKFDALPRSGRAANTPWPESYWPTYQDSTNHRWRDGDLSPTEKYDVAFNGWAQPEGFMNLRPYDPNDCAAGFDQAYYEKLGPASRWMSEHKGNKAARDLVYRDGADKPPVCDDKVREAVESWWGLCHAWTPASINEPEPLHPVTVNGVTFYPSDIKALLMTVYDSSKSIILGGRCNDKEVKRDEEGRIIDAACRDTNAGAFHVIMANFLGRYNMGLIEDRTYDYQVWNQPVYNFEVEQAQEVDLAKANTLLNVKNPGTTYKFNDKAVKFVEVFARVDYVTESYPSEEPLVPMIESYTRSDNYHYLLELDKDGKIIGGEWLQGRAQSDMWGISQQPDFLWYATGPNTSSFSGTNPYVKYEKVKELLEKSRAAEQPDQPVTDANKVNFTTEAGVDIPDADANGVTSTLTVAETRTATTVWLNVDITHTYVGDLEIVLKKDDGFEKVVRSKEGGSADDIHTQIEVKELAGKALAGAYTLVVRDTARIDTGKLVRWGLSADVQ
jgi:hypothetical protein